MKSHLLDFISFFKWIKLKIERLRITLQDLSALTVLLTSQAVESGFPPLYVWRRTRGLDGNWRLCGRDADDSSLVTWPRGRAAPHSGWELARSTLLKGGLRWLTVNVRYHLQDHLHGPLASAHVASLLRLFQLKSNETLCFPFLAQLCDFNSLAISF